MISSGMNMHEQLKKEFHEAMLETYRVAARSGYRASGFLHVIAMEGSAWQAAKYLLSTGTEVQSGLDRLWELDLLDRSMEALVLEERFKVLFEDWEREVARERLEARQGRQS